MCFSSSSDSIFFASAGVRSDSLICRGAIGLPARGATIVAAEQQTGHTVNSIVSINGQYYFTLPQGKYIILVAYPDGSNKNVGDF